LNHRKIGLVITNKSYEHPIVSASWSELNGTCVNYFLKQECGFSNITLLQDRPKEDILSELTNLKNFLANLRHSGEKVLIFIYYSGHGFEQDGLTHGYNLDGSLFDLENRVRVLSKFANTTVVAVLECGRRSYSTYLNCKT